MQVRYFLTVGLVGVLALSVASPALAEGPLPPRVTMNGKEWLTLTQQEFYENPRVQGMDKVLKEITAKPFRSKATYESEGDYSYEYITYDGRITRVAERAGDPHCVSPGLKYKMKPFESEEDEWKLGINMRVADTNTVIQIL